MLYTSVATIVLCLAYSVVRWTHPCNSGTIGYFLMEECRHSERSLNWSWSSKLQLILVSAITFWLSTDVFGSVVFSFVHLDFAQIYCLLGYMKFVTRIMITEPSRAAKNLLKYRQLQILNRFHNAIHEDKLIILVLFLMQFEVIICFYALVADGLEASVLRFAIYITVGPICASVLVMYTTFMGRIYCKSKTSSRMIKDSLKVSSRKEKRWIARVMLSCKPLKCQIGYVNFVDELTPLNLLSFCFVQIANLLLLKK